MHKFGEDLEVNNDSHNSDDILVISIDEDGKIVEFNKEFEQVTGLKKEEIIKIELFDTFVPEDQFIRWMKLFDSARLEKKVRDFKLPIYNKKGDEVDIFWNISEVYNNENEKETICFTGKLTRNLNKTNESQKIEKQEDS